MQSGKWGDDEVPKSSWRCINIEDLGKPNAICEMCEKQQIRYVHTMEHDNYEDLKTGCICAGHMEGNIEGAREREKELKNLAQRRRNWLNRSWKTSSKGNPYIKTDGYHIVLFKKDELYSGKITDINTSKEIYARREYRNLDEAKLASFDAIIFLKRQVGKNVYQHQ